jgi:aspartate-semialdehyde dehydrogenase
MVEQFGLAMILSLTVKASAFTSGTINFLLTSILHADELSITVMPASANFGAHSKEEMKMVNETKKIMQDDSIKVTATTVRIPVMGGHSESVNIEFENDFDLNELKEFLRNSPGIIVQDDPSQQIYPMPLTAHEKDEVFVGRIRRDETQPNTLNMWIVSDNLRKGAATNAVQIAEYLLSKNLLS